jgi:hypothetical protein
MRIDQLFYFALISTMLLFFQTAFAQDSEGKKAKKIVYQKKTEIDFSDVLISGELMKPEGIYVKKRKDIRFGSLIELRSNFRPELMKSANDL